MAENFYNIHASDETANTYLNYQIEQQRPQMYQQNNHQQQQALFGATTVPTIHGIREFDTPAANSSTSYAATDINNNGGSAAPSQTANWSSINNTTVKRDSYDELFLPKVNSNITQNSNNGGTNGAGAADANGYHFAAPTYMHENGTGRNGNLFPSLANSSMNDNVLDGNAFLSVGGAAVVGATNDASQFVPNVSSTGTFYNRHRYAPYTQHNRHYATTRPSMSHTQTAAYTCNSNVITSKTNISSIGNAFQQLTFQPLISYNNQNGNATSVTSLAKVTAKNNSSNENALNTTDTTASSTISQSSSHDNSGVTYSNSISSIKSICTIATVTSSNIATVLPYANRAASAATLSEVNEVNEMITLQITNLDYTMDENSLRNFLLNQLNPITPVISLTLESNSLAKVTVPDLFFAKQVVSNLHRKKIGHKRMVVSYTRDSSLTEIKTLRCQVAGLLKDVPYYTLPMYKFRELFQSRFKTSISVMDLYKMPDICIIATDTNEDKVISLRAELVNSLDTSPLVEGLQHSVPYCTTHFKREQHKGWAEQEIEALPNISMSIADLQKIIYPLLNSHPGDIPIATLLHCIEGQLNIQLNPNENGVNLEHLVCCIQGIQIQMNNFGIKILGWIEVEKMNRGNSKERMTPVCAVANSTYAKNNMADSMHIISREVIELIKMSPKSTMKFNRFIPAYHNHFGKQCRVADYGYTKLIELFEALSTVVQIMGDGENRQITLTHRTQVRRFTSDLLRVLRAYGNRSILLSQLPDIFSQIQLRPFDITDYGVCDVIDILDGLVYSNVIVVSSVRHSNDILISIPRRKQTAIELERTSVFAGEMVELFSMAPQYAILFQKFVRSYHYHFSYQCRLSDYGFLKLADLMDAIQGIVELELSNEEDRKIFLSVRVAQRVFAEQCAELIRCSTGSSNTCMRFTDVLELHKKKYGYQIQPQTLGVRRLEDVIELLPNVEVSENEAKGCWIICHNTNAVFRMLCYRVIKYVQQYNAQPTTTPTKKETNSHVDPLEQDNIPSKKSRLTNDPINDISLGFLLQQFNNKYNESLNIPKLKAMRQFIEIYIGNNHSIQKFVRLSPFAIFLLDIVRNLEQRPKIILHQLKQLLECNLGSTFEFGYPNLFNILTAHPDLFAVNINSVQEQSEIALLATCELRSSLPQFKTSATNVSNITRLPINNTVAWKPTTRTTRTAFIDCNGRTPPVLDSALSSQQGPMAMKNEAFSGSDSKVGCITPYQVAQQQYMTYSQSSNKSEINSSGMNIGKQFVSMSTNMNNNMPYTSTVKHSSSFLNSSGSNKENSVDTSLNNTSFFNSSSSSSLTDFNYSFDRTNANFSITSSPQQSMYHNTTKLWGRCMVSPYRQSQQLLVCNKSAQSLNQAPLEQINTNRAAGYNPFSSHPEQSGINEFINNVQKCPNYKPPKPDTPPSMEMPFWIDPIWTHNAQNDQHHEQEFNIKLPEMKIFDDEPMPYSPYTQSKTENMKQAFSFENQDRKLA